VIGGGKLKIDPPKKEVILKWSVPTKVINVKSLVVVVQYLWKFIEYFLAISMPLHAITTYGKSF
jgi:hypothetical protein